MINLVGSSPFSATLEPLEVQREELIPGVDRERVSTRDLQVWPFNMQSELEEFKAFPVLEAEPEEKMIVWGDCNRETHVSDMPHAILTDIFSLISDPRSRNSMALTCWDWYSLERQSHTSLSLRGNICSLQELPMCYKQVCSLDVSLCSPWGYSLFQSTPNGEEIGNVLKAAFPNVTELTVYVRDALDIQMVAWLWPELEIVHLVRWHQRAMDNEASIALGLEIEGLLRMCGKLKVLDLSKFYCWTEDIPPALQAGSAVAANLRSLNLLKLSPEGFKSQEVGAITAACPNLEEFYILCEFDHRFLDSVGDEALLVIANSCRQLKVLHLVDTNEFTVSHGNADDHGYAREDSNISRQGLEAMFKALPHLEELTFLLSQNVRDSGPAFEVFATHCKRMRSLKLSNFHGVCRGPQPDGIALCSGLLDLSIKDCADLMDSGLEAIATGCKKLSKLGLRGCKWISEDGLRNCVDSLAYSLKDVEVAFCRLLPTSATLRALQPIQKSITRLHMDCVWDEANPVEGVPSPASVSELRSQELIGFCTADAGTSRLGEGISGWQDINFGVCGAGNRLGEMTRRKRESLAPHRLDSQRRRLGVAENGRESQGLCAESNGSVQARIWGAVPRSSQLRTGFSRDGGKGGTEVIMSNGKHGQGPERDIIHSSELHQVGSLGRHASDPLLEKSWKSLQFLSLWIAVDKRISSLPSMGLGCCPILQEVKIRVEGDCRGRPKPNVHMWGISAFQRYTMLAKLELDLGEVTGYSLSAPEGFMDLSLWERHFLGGVQALHQLTELDYWPPSDKEVNRRGLSLPAAGLLSQCSTLRKLFVHGTAHEHFLMMLVRCENLRDVQLRGDYYPAPECETSTEMRTVSCQRFEAAVANRGFPD